MDTTNKKIAVKIYGNVHSSAGFEPILSLGALIPPLEYTRYEGMGRNYYYFVIHNGVAYSMFTLVQNGVSSSGAVRGGCLKIAVGIPRGMKIDGKISPMTLLIQIRELFTSRYMTQSETGVRQFRDDIDKESLSQDVEELLVDYPLIPSNSPHVPMKDIGDGPLGLLLIDAEKTALLMRDSQYPEFKDLSEVIVAPQSDGTDGYEQNLTGTIDIPRKPQVVLSSKDNEVSESQSNADNATGKRGENDNKKSWLRTLKRYAIVFFVGFAMGLLLGIIIHVRTLPKTTPENVSSTEQSDKKAEIQTAQPKVKQVVDKDTIQDTL